MTDVLTTAGASLVVGGAGITIASLLPGLDLSAVIGSFGGAFFFILFAKEIAVWQRAGYLIVGWIGGYFGAAEILSQTWTNTSGFSSFVAGLVCVVTCISVIESYQTRQLPWWAQALLGRISGKKDTE